MALFLVEHTPSIIYPGLYKAKTINVLPKFEWQTVISQSAKSIKQDTWSLFHKNLKQEWLLTF